MEEMPKKYMPGIQEAQNARIMVSIYIKKSSSSMARKMSDKKSICIGAKQKPACSTLTSDGKVSEFIIQRY